MRYNYNKLDLGIPENGIAEQTSSKKTIYPKQGVFNHLLSSNNVVYFQKGGKQGIHSEHMGFILTELQYMQRAYPNMQW